MKYIFLSIIFLLQICAAFSQNINIIKPATSAEISYSKTESLLWSKALEQYSKINSGELIYESLTLRDKQFIDSLESGLGPLTQGPGCSWYCGGGPYKITSDSYLKQQGNITYNPNNIHDFDLFTAWVPDVKDGVIGKRINFHFKPFAPRINEISVYNGYLKNTDLWKANARAKKLKLYINNKPVALLELSDESGIQTFKIEPVQSTDKAKDLILTLEILEVYEGTKYKDVAISEINFNGLDVHCFTGETKITMADKSEKEIQHINTGDKILAFNTSTGAFFETEVTELITALHHNLFELQFDGFNVVSTDDHPFFVACKGWCSVNPAKSNRNYFQETPVAVLQVDDNILAFKDSKQCKRKLLSLKPVNSEQLTYTLKLSKGNCFVANGLLVKTESFVVIESNNR